MELITILLVRMRMAELGLVEYFEIGEAFGIIGTLFVLFYFSRKQMRELSVDIETKVLNDLDDKLHGIVELAVARPEVAEILDSQSANQGTKNLLRCMFYTYTHTHFICVKERGVKGQ